MPYGIYLEWRRYNYDFGHKLDSSFPQTQNYAGRGLFIIEKIIWGDVSFFRLKEVGGSPYGGLSKIGCERGMQL